MSYLSVLVLMVLLGCPLAQGVPLHPPAIPIPATYFGLDVESPPGLTPPGRIWRLWDAGVGWRDVQPQQGQWDFSRLDAFVNRAQQGGAQISYVFGMTPQWAAAHPDEPGNYNLPGMASAPRDLADWKAYITTLAQRYKGRIRLWEIWNEANDPGYYSGDTATLVQMAAIAYSTLKAADPLNIVVAPAVSPAGGADLDWLDGYLAQGGGSSADVINYHLYALNGQPEQMADLATQVKAVMARHGQQGKPLWNTESGWQIASSQHALDPLSDVGPVLPAQQAADYLARSYVVNWASGVGRFYWYAWDDSNFGLLETDGQTLKPAGRAYQRIQSWLLGARMTGCSTGSTAWSCSLVTATGQPALVAWAPNGSGSLRLPPGWNGAVLSRLDGTSGLLAAGASLSLTGSPVLLAAPRASPVAAPAATDRLPPGLAIVSPQAHARVGATQRVMVRLNDNVGVTRVAYYVDGRLLMLHAGKGMTQDSWQWTGIQAGPHRLQVRAYDAAGNWRSRVIPVIR